MARFPKDHLAAKYDDESFNFQRYTRYTYDRAYTGGQTWRRTQHVTDLTHIIRDDLKVMHQIFNDGEVSPSRPLRTKLHRIIESVESILKLLDEQEDRDRQTSAEILGTRILQRRKYQKGRKQRSGKTGS